MQQADEAGLRLVRFLWCGNDGTVRAKASSLNGLEGRMESGIGLTVAMQAMNSLDQLQPVEGMGPVGEIRLVPDPETFRVLPYAPHLGAMLVDQRQLDGEPAPVCQRTFLKRMEQRLAERGVRLEAAFENEFSLATQVDGEFVPIDSGWDPRWVAAITLIPQATMVALAAIGYRLSRSPASTLPPGPLVAPVPIV